MKLRRYEELSLQERKDLQRGIEWVVSFIRPDFEVGLPHGRFVIPCKNTEEMLAVRKTIHQIGQVVRMQSNRRCNISPERIIFPETDHEKILEYFCNYYDFDENPVYPPKDDV